jgi:hypothetical protein
MAIQTWPTTLPQVPQRGYTEVLGTNILRTNMDAGPAKMRFRGKRPDMLSVQFLMTTAQVSTLENFVQNTIFGVRRFNFTHPRKASSVEVRIVPQQDGALFNISYTAPGYYTVSLQFEVLP